MHPPSFTWHNFVWTMASIQQAALADRVHTESGASSKELCGGCKALDLEWSMKEEWWESTHARVSCAAGSLRGPIALLWRPAFCQGHVVISRCVSSPHEQTTTPRTGLTTSSTAYTQTDTEDLFQVAVCRHFYYSYLCLVGLSFLSYVCKKSESF